MGESAEDRTIIIIIIYYIIILLLYTDGKPMLLLTVCSKKMLYRNGKYERRIKKPLNSKQFVRITTKYRNVSKGEM